MAQPVAYLRRSRVDTRRPGTLSHEQQLERIRAKAATHGDHELLVIEDWGKSGREDRTHTRSGFARLEAMLDAGEASAIYAYDLSRLGRSLVTVYRLARRADELKVPIRCAEGLSPDVSDPHGRLVLAILLAIGEFYAESTRDRARSLVMMRRQRGDRIGPAPYGQRVRGGKLEPEPAEDLDALLGAYRRAGSVQAACRLLNAEGVRTRKGGPWQPSTLAQVLEAAGALTRRPRPGRPPSRTFLLSGLLRCHCGATLTGVTTNKGRNVAYECKRARSTPEHGRPTSVAESHVLPWIQGEAARFAPGVEAVEIDGDAAVDRDSLEARRRRTIELYKAGRIEREELDSDLEAIEAQIATAPSARVVDLPALDWAGSPVAVNTYLRALWDHVALGAGLRPVSAAWRVPAENVA